MSQNQQVIVSICNSDRSNRNMMDQYTPARTFVKGDLIGKIISPDTLDNRLGRCGKFDYILIRWRKWPLKTTQALL